MQTPKPKRKLPPSQIKRKEKYSRQLKAFNVQKPVQAMYAKNVKTMQALKDMLAQTWNRHWDDLNNYSRFSEKQMKFAREYAINGRRNVGDAMRRAGYTLADKQNLLAAARSNLRQPYMEELIQAFELEEKAKMGLRIQDVADWYEKIAMAAMDAGDFNAANRAMELYGKYLGMFVEKKEILHKTLYTKGEVDSRIAELSAILKDHEPEIADKLRIN